MDEYRDDLHLCEKPKNLNKMQEKAEKLIKEKEQPKIKPHKIFKDFKLKRKAGRF